jgi:hypothetical protein
MLTLCTLLPKHIGATLNTVYLGVPLRTTNGSHHTAVSTPAKKLAVAIRFQPRYASARRHFELFQDFAGMRIDAPYIAFLAFPSAVPQLSIDPSDTGDKAIGFDRAQYRSRLRIDLMNFSSTVLAYPQGPV